MARQPLYRKHPDAGVELGPGFLERRPLACVQIAQIIAGWSDVEFQFANLFATFMVSDAERTIAVFLALRSARVQKQILRTAATSALTEPKDIALFDAFMSAAAPLEAERNDLAHGLFGITSASEHGVLWVSQDDRIKLHLDSGSGGITPFDAFKPKIAIYELADLQRTMAQITEYHGLLYGLNAYARSRNAELYDQLAAQPPIREALASQKAAATPRNP